MKYTFNNKNIITGFIKGLLKDFNLPTCPVYIEGQSDIVGKTYIKGNYFVKLNKDIEVINVHEYTRGKSYGNLTKNLVLKSNYYDQYTHEYLGDYLRFLRDYDGVNLMPLYNCYSGETLNSLKKYLSEFNRQSLRLPDNGSYNYYVFPVKLNQTYTIKVNSSINFDVFILIGNKFEHNYDLAKATRKKLCSASKNNLPIYKTDKGSLLNDKIIELYPTIWEYMSLEPALKMIIKLPSWVKTSITVLEGDYRINSSGASGESFIPRVINFIPESGKFICNQSRLYCGTRLSLLENNSNISYPFADRLIEYLIRLAITHLNKIERNVGRIQNKVYKNRIFKGYYDIFDDNLLSRLYEISKTPYNEVELSNGKKIQNYKKIGKTILNRPYILKDLDLETTLLGDIDKDGKITVYDALSILRVAAKLEACNPEISILGDLDKDGNITVNDALMALRIADDLAEAEEIIIKTDKIKKGDIDQDGNITVYDALLILRVAAKLANLTTNFLTLGDIDQDGDITVNDALKVLRVAAKLDSPDSLTLSSTKIIFPASEYSGPYKFKNGYTIWLQKNPEILNKTSLIDHEDDLLFFVDKDLERLVNSL